MIPIFNIAIKPATNSFCVHLKKDALLNLKKDSAEVRKFQGSILSKRFRSHTEISFGSARPARLV